MNFEIDVILFIGFLTLIIFFGLTSSRGVKTIKEYALENNLSTGAMVSTIVATWVCGEMFFSTITETYQHGLYFIISCIFGFVFSFILIAYFFAPRMQRFLGKLSIATAMGDLYGKEVRLITSICGFIGVTGIIATQLKIAGIVFQYTFNLSEMYCVIIAGIIVTIYSTLGGIKSVVFTDIIQFFAFGVIIPMVSYHLFVSVGDIFSILNTIDNNPHFSLDTMLNPSNEKSWYYLFIFFYALIPGFNPATFQRIAMAKDYKQLSQSFYISSVVILTLMLSLAWLGIIFLTKNPNVNPNNIIQILLFNECTPFYRVLLLIAIVAMVLSTVDSYINSSSVLLSHDFFQSLNIKINNELIIARIISCTIGLLGILFALKEFSLFKLAIFTASFYMPIVTVPFIMAIFGYQTPFKRAVLWGMGAGFLTVLLWNYYNISLIDPIVPGMFINLVTLVFMHYYYLEKRSKASN